jgi:hypothetical protein
MPRPLSHGTKNTVQDIEALTRILKRAESDGDSEPEERRSLCGLLSGAIAILSKNLSERGPESRRHKNGKSLGKTG